MEKLYKILKTYECPTGRICTGVTKTESEWQKVFPHLEKGHCDIKQDWFECVELPQNYITVDVSKLFGERYDFCKDQPAQIDCRVKDCKYNKSGGCYNISPVIKVHKGSITCWTASPGFVVFD